MIYTKEDLRKYIDSDLKSMNKYPLSLSTKLAYETRPPNISFLKRVAIHKVMDKRQEQQRVIKALIFMGL